MLLVPIINSMIMTGCIILIIKIKQFNTEKYLIDKTTDLIEKGKNNLKSNY